jgi:hypothetical protein
MTRQEEVFDEVGNQECFEHTVGGNASLGTITISDLTGAFEKVSVSVCQKNVEPKKMLICDAGYGFPKETRPRKEKINAIARQLSNFLVWQIDGGELNGNSVSMAQVRVVGCPDEATISILHKKISDNLKINELPTHLVLSCESLEQMLASVDAKQSPDPAVYLSPDADRSLDPSIPPPAVVVVGLLIDRRTQPNRSKERASKLSVVAKRLPLKDCFVGISAREPLNVDCVLEVMQQWWWNCKEEQNGGKEAFIEAASQGIERHAKRHPSRPLHVQPGI